MAEAQQPILVKPISAQIVNEGAAFGPLDLNEYIQSTNKEGGVIRFRGELADGNPLPQGLICTESGMVSGIPPSGTQGDYTIVITAENESGIPFTTEFKLTIKERIAMASADLYSDLKSRVWEALGKDLPLPDMGDILNRPISPVEVYYLLQRWATLTIWDVYNLEPPSVKQLLNIEGVSKHYDVYDRGSCLVAAPKDLYSHERTLEDALQTSRALAREVYNRGWVIEFAGFDKMVRAAWIELQLLGDKHGKQLEILHYTPSEEDLRIYAARAQGPGFKI